MFDVNKTTPQSTMFLVLVSTLNECVETVFHEHRMEEPEEEDELVKLHSFLPSIPSARPLPCKGTGMDLCGREPCQPGVVLLF